MVGIQNNLRKCWGFQKNDFYNQYLAYHEGQNGWKNKSFNSKKWLLGVAKKVETNANKYNNQLKDCENKLNAKRIIWNILMPILNSINQMQDEMKTWRQELHRIPEIGLKEYKTSLYIKEKLKKWV